MSYILEALRKSDQQRQRGAAPTLLTLQPSAPAPAQPAYWIHGVIAAVLVGVGIVIGWLHPWPPEQPVPAGETAAVRPLESSPRQTAPATVALPPGPPAPGPAMARGRPAASVPKARMHGMPPEAVAAASTQTSTPVSEKPVIPGPADPAQEQRVMTLEELPVSIRQELPGMQISLHLYSTRPKNRFVSINGKMLQEGEDAAPGIRLERITPDGMIFSYKGYRFSRGVQQ